MINSNQLLFKNNKGGNSMKFSNENGLSLIEVIMSIFLLSILIIPIFSLLTMNIKVNLNAREHILATSLAENEIEKLKSNELKSSKSSKSHRGFTINSVIQLLDDLDEKKTELFKIRVEVKKQGKTIEEIITYKNSLKEVN